MGTEGGAGVPVAGVFEFESEPLSPFEFTTGRVTDVDGDSFAFASPFRDSASRDLGSTMARSFCGVTVRVTICLGPLLLEESAVLPLLVTPLPAPLLVVAAAVTVDDFRRSLAIEAVLFEGAMVNTEKVEGVLRNLGGRQ